MSLLALETELFLDRFNQAFAEFLAVDRQDRLAAVEEEFEMRSLLSAELHALFCQPPLELRTLHDLRVHIFDYRRKFTRLSRSMPDGRVPRRVFVFAPGVGYDGSLPDPDSCPHPPNLH